jgi:hypothetical protein
LTMYDRNDRSRSRVGGNVNGAMRGRKRRTIAARSANAVRLIAMTPRRLTRPHMALGRLMEVVALAPQRSMSMNDRFRQRSSADQCVELVHVVHVEHGPHISRLLALPRGRPFTSFTCRGQPHIRRHCDGHDPASREPRHAFAIARTRAPEVRSAACLLGRRTRWSVPSPPSLRLARVKRRWWTPVARGCGRGPEWRTALTGLRRGTWQ